jgi:hypothetical protein
LTSRLLENIVALIESMINTVEVIASSVISCCTEVWP